MEFFGNLGIDWKILIAQIVNFGLLLWILNKFLYKPVVARIEKDEKALNQAQLQKKELAKEKDSFLKEKNKDILKAKKRAKEIIKEAEEIAEEIKERTMLETDKEKNAIIKQIKSRLDEK